MSANVDCFDLTNGNHGRVAHRQGRGGMMSTEVRFEGVTTMVKLDIWKDEDGVTLTFDDEYVCDLSHVAFSQLAEKLTDWAERRSNVAGSCLFDPDDDVEFENDLSETEDE